MNNSSRILLIFSACTLCIFSANAQQQAEPSPGSTQNSPAASSSAGSGDKKTKKVWTDDDLHGLGGVSVVGSATSGAKGHPSPGNGKEGAAASYKQQLAKLQAQLDELNRKLAELHNFNGESSKDTAIQSNHRLTRGSISDQIAQLETRKSQLSEQMQKIFDDARHSGIEPGALR